VRIALAVFLVCFQQLSLADIQGVRLWHAPDNSRLVFDLDRGTDHKLFSLSSPNRLVIDIEDSKLLKAIENLPTQTGPVKKVRSGMRNNKDLRIVLDLREAVEPKSFQLKPNKNYGHRLVVDLYHKSKAKVSGKAKAIPISKPVYQANQSLKSKRDIIVVVDAGHGGEDPGAIGHGGVREKKVVLAIAKKLEKLLEKEKGFKAKLVRTGDYYVGLRERTKRARKANADLFISIHADAFSSPKASGGSVFALSQKGGTSEAARWLADKENASDLIGGVGGVSLDDKEDLLAGVLLDLSMTASLGVSLELGQMVLSSMGGVGHLHKRRVEQAGFAVLKSPDIPSLLVETGFLSNPREAKKLNSSSYQTQMAKAIFKGIQRYFQQSPPVGTLLASLKNGNAKINGNRLRKYIIAPGDTLSVIAQKHATSMAKLKSLNGLKSSTIRVGQVLKVPAS
jgi:N-acetylmuramoyl-L-alanine amidase